VNLEVDVLAKYTERLLAFSTAAPAAGRRNTMNAAAESNSKVAAPAAPHRKAMPAAGPLRKRCRHGRRQAVLAVDNEDRENEGDIIFAAQHATPALMGWTIRYSSGVICVPLSGERADALALPPMVEVNQDAKGTAYTVSCDAATESAPESPPRTGP
jgi:3,4-dihydroxy 2-butanone 4-phosphate synthase